MYRSPWRFAAVAVIAFALAGTSRTQEKTPVKIDWEKLRAHAVLNNPGANATYKDVYFEANVYGCSITKGKGDSKHLVMGMCMEGGFVVVGTFQFNDERNAPLKSLVPSADARFVIRGVIREVVAKKNFTHVTADVWLVK